MDNWLGYEPLQGMATPLQLLRPRRIQVRGVNCRRLGPIGLAIGYQLQAGGEMVS